MGVRVLECWGVFAFFLLDFSSALYEMFFKELELLETFRRLFQYQHYRFIYEAGAAAQPVRALAIL